MSQQRRTQRAKAKDLELDFPLDGARLRLQVLGILLHLLQRGNVVLALLLGQLAVGFDAL